MDFNNIESRLKRVYASIGLIFVTEYEKEVSFNINENKESGETIIENQFGSKNEDTNLAKIMAVISAIGNLKDNIKKKLSTLGLEKDLVELEINSYLVLQLITDLDNSVVS